MKFKKLIIGMFLCGCVLLSFGGCMSNTLNGKEGLFAEIDTSKGKIYVELFYKDTPLTVTNFVGLAEGTLDAAKGKKFYDGLTFHRVISKANGDGQDFMIQGGDPRGNGSGGPGYTFPDEIIDSLKFTEPGFLAMANSGAGVGGMGTNGSQFFITIVETPWLNGKHTIFGKVVDEESQKVVNSMKIKDKINSVTIYRLGADAEAFSATQADFDERKAVAVKEVKARKDAAAQARIAEVEKAFPGFQKDSHGIYFKTTKAGNGEKVGPGKYVVVEYKGYLVDGSLFDASSKFVPGSHGPLDFTTNSGEMIPGFDIMVQDMTVGEVRTIVIPSDYAYGDTGIPQAGIEGGAFLAFDIEVVSAK